MHERALDYPTDGLTDEWYRRLALAYDRVVAEGKHPGPALKAETGIESVKTVHRWIYQARKLGFMPPGVRGRSGTTGGSDD
jgi:hypothetical protein